MKYGFPVMCSVGKMLVWVFLILYTAVIVGGWCIVKAENSIHQCVFAAQVVAGLLIGYIIGRALVCIMDEVEKVITTVRGKEEQPKLYQRHTPPPIPIAAHTNEQNS